MEKKLSPLCICCGAVMEPHPGLGAFVTHPALEPGEPPVMFYLAEAKGGSRHGIDVYPFRCPACGLVLMFEKPAVLKEVHES